AGNRVIQDINTNGVSGATQPDIVLANSPDPNGNPGYQALIVYVIPNSSTSADGTAWLEIYDINNIGTPAISLSQRSRTSLSFTCNGYPHIDMWSDAQNLTNGLPTMTDFEIVWADGIKGTLMGSSGTVNLGNMPPVSLPTTSAADTNVYMPDVACVISNDPVQGGATSRQIELAYGNGVNDIKVRTIIAANVIHEEMQESGGSWTSTSGPSTLATYRPFAPRIEAMSQWVSGSSDAKWQIAVTNMTNQDVRGYNNLANANLSSFTYSPPITNPIFQAACVAAGVGPYWNSTNIGNRQYTAGYYPWGTPNNFSRDISVATGGIITSAPYVINDITQPVENWWDNNQSLSLSNSSNSGRDLLAAWSDTLGIVYKYSSTNTGTTWRILPKAQAGTMTVFPNPMQETLYLNATETGTQYSIQNAAGNLLQSGKNIEAKGIDISRLPAGSYILRTQEANGSTNQNKFIKK
ncbi:MAG: T9SS type A sorting domain-containing protein, partial [Bacteroidetes bacterium]|nr:T9SS type A sorting domain-containing protein [Bacteroidota bacterium]